MKIFYTMMLVLSATFGFAQEKVETSVYVPTTNIGGKPEFEHIFNTQLVYPENLLASKTSSDVSVYFSVAVDGTVSHVRLNQSYDPALEKEARRLMKFYVFDPAIKDGVKVEGESSFVFKFNAEAYKKICKTRGFVTPAFAKLPADTNFVIYHRADASPVYYKGDEALGEFVLRELEYPPLAVRQNIEGTVILNFIVEPNGCPSNIRVQKGVTGGCSEEAIRVLRLTRWTPANKDGRSVRYYMTYPIVFNLVNVSKDNAMGGQR